MGENAQNELKGKYRRKGKIYMDILRKFNIYIIRFQKKE